MNLLKQHKKFKIYGKIMIENTILFGFHSTKYYILDKRLTKIGELKYDNRYTSKKQRNV